MIFFMSLILNTFTIYFAITNLVAHSYSHRIKQVFFFSILIFTYIIAKTDKFVVYLMLIFLGGIILYFSSQKLYDILMLQLGYGCALLTDYAASLIVLHVFHVTVEVLFSVEYIAGFSVVIMVCTYLITKLAGILLRGYLLPVLEKLPQYVVICAVLEFILCITIFIYLFSFGNQLGYTTYMMTVNGILFFLLFSISAVIITILIRSLMKEMKMKSIAREYEILKEYSEKLEKANLSIRSFKHDYLSIITSIEGFLDEGAYEELKTYFSQNILPLNEELQTYDTRISSLHHIKQPEIKSLLQSKIIYGQNQKVDYYLFIPEDIEQIPMKPVDLLRILGVYLDNANEAALETPEKRVELSITQDDTCVTIVIRNSCKEEPVQQNLSQLNYSTKGENRGYGLYNVRQILNRYDTVSNETECQDFFFTQKLYIEKKHSPYKII